MAEAVLVRDIMTRDVKVVGLDADLRRVVETMNRYRIGSVVVVKDKHPVGLITERDVLKCVARAGFVPEVWQAKDVMSSPLITIKENTTVEEAADLMVRQDIKKLPVINKGKLVGIITYTDIIRALPYMLSVFKEFLCPPKT